VSVSGFGNLVPSPYASWPAYASVVEAMSGIYEYRRPPGGPPVTLPVGALGDISSALFATVGILAALRHRDRTGEGQYVDVAMLDAVMAMTDIVTNFWSLGLRPEPDGALKEPDVIVHGFRASDGWFVLQVAREHQFTRLASVVGRPEWADDPRFATRSGWIEHLDTVIRPGIEAWAADHTKLEAARALSEAGVPAGPCSTAADLVDDPHVAARHMLVELPRTDDVADPVLIPGNPVKLSKTMEGPETRVPWVGEHTEEVLTGELGLSPAELADLRAAGVVT
jgi:formyl-CoA transferase